MYEKDGEKYFIVDGHVHFWDAGPDEPNRYGEGFIDCFYDYHRNLTRGEVWPKDKFTEYTEGDIMHDLFEVGYVDKAIFQPTYLKDFYPDGFNTIEQNAEIAEKHPDRFIVNGAFDPRDGELGLRKLEEDHRRHGIKGVKLYTAEWKGDSRGYKLTRPRPALPGEVPGARHHQHPRPQGPDDLAARPRRVRRRRTSTSPPRSSPA